MKGEGEITILRKVDYYGQQIKDKRGSWEPYNLCTYVCVCVCVLGGTLGETYNFEEVKRSVAGQLEVQLLHDD